MSITLRFVSSSDIVSRIIRGGELGFLYQHVEARMPDGTLLGAHADGGVQARAADYDKTYIQDLYVTVPCQPDAVATFHDFLRSQIGKPYDMKAIAEMADGFITGESPNWPGSSICRWVIKSKSGCLEESACVANWNCRKNGSSL